MPDYTSAIPKCVPSAGLMTLEDFYAGCALTGILAFSPEGEGLRQSSAKDAADDAFAFAKAMMKRREELMRLHREAATNTGFPEEHQ